MADGTLRLIHPSNLQRIYGLDVAVDGLAQVAITEPVLDAQVAASGSLMAMSLGLAYGSAA